MRKAALLTLLVFAITLSVHWIGDAPTFQSGAAPSTVSALQPRGSADRMKQPAADNANLAMMFWLEEQIAAFADQLDRETIPERRRALQSALDRSRAELAHRSGVVTLSPRGRRTGIDSVRAWLERQ